MILKLKRMYFKNTYTIGNLYIDDKFFCNTLEDKNRDLNKNGKFDNGESKVYSETCIPFGIYKVNVTWSPKFKRYLPILLNVPSFDGIRIHRGNTDKDSSGCIIVGENKVVGKVINSTQYELKLTEIIKRALNNKEDVVIEVV